MVPAFVARCEDQKPKPKKKDAKDNKDNKDAKDTVADPNDEAARILAEKDKEKGSVTIGKDPAFILMPRPLDRNESAQELMTPQVKEMIEKALAMTRDVRKGMPPRKLAREEGLLVGVSSGANLCAAILVAKRLKEQGRDGTVVTIFCDSAAKYLSESFWHELNYEAENWP